MSQMQTRSGYKALSHPVLLNDLILENIFSFFELEEYLPLGLVCQKWNTAIRKKISKDVTAVFTDEPNQRMIGEITESAHYFNLLKITKVNLKHCKIPLPAIIHGDENRYKRFLETMNKCGKQVKRFSFNYFLFTEEDLVEMKKILNLMPNLEHLGLPAFTGVGNFWKVFEDFCQPKLKSLRLPNYSPKEEEPAETFIKAVFKSFPNLETNLGQSDLDVKLLKMILAKKVSMKLTRFAPDFYAEDFNPNCLPLLTQLSPRVHELSKLELWVTPEFELSTAQTIFDILKHFASTLNTFAICCDDGCKKDVELRLPPLPQLRCLLLDITFCFKEKTYLTCNMGKKIAKDYPLLEYFEFQPLFWHPYGPAANDRKPWKVFVPEVEETTPPLKFLRFADLNFPHSWIKDERNRKWCQKYFDGYLKVYGNGGRGTIQEFIDWLRLN